MRCSQLYFPTLKDPPTNAEVISHQLLLRAGMIRRLASGIYTWLPLGLKVLRKVESIVRQEMNSIQAQEILMPNLQPAELWKESRRWESYGPELLRVMDRHQRLFCFGPTHEEVITELLRNEVRSYKQLPLIFYQIQTKFRDEIRPRFGIMRAREFLMKDAYSFHLNKQSLVETYQLMHKTYCKIFNRLGLKFLSVLADTGNIGGYESQEFQVLSKTGEDQIFYSDKSCYAANAELAAALPPAAPAPSNKMLEKIKTAGKNTIESISTYLNRSPQDCLKVLIVKGTTSPFVGLVLRGDHQLNIKKAEKLEEIKKPLAFAQASEVLNLGLPLGYIGPIGLSIPIIMDLSARIANFVCGANEEGLHYINANWDRDCLLPKTADLRQVIVGDPSPDGIGSLKMERGIEVGHIFQLGRKYSSLMSAEVTTAEGGICPLEMGCYGIGISRIVGAAIEQNHDEHGIIWPESMAPYQMVIIGISYHRSYKVKQATDLLYQQLQEQRFDVLLDDRKEHPGLLFSDHDLIGIPHRFVINEKNLLEKKIEYKNRKEKKIQFIQMDEITQFLTYRLGLKPPIL